MARSTSACPRHRALRPSPRCSGAGCPRKLLYFPDENHWVLKPQNSILWHETVLAWLDEWTAADEGPAAGQ